MANRSSSKLATLTSPPPPSSKAQALAPALAPAPQTPAKATNLSPPAAQGKNGLSPPPPSSSSGTRPRTGAVNGVVRGGSLPALDTGQGVNRNPQTQSKKARPTTLEQLPTPSASGEAGAQQRKLTRQDGADGASFRKHRPTLEPLVQASSAVGGMQGERQVSQGPAISGRPDTPASTSSASMVPVPTLSRGCTPRCNSEIIRVPPLKLDNLSKLLEAADQKEEIQWQEAQELKRKREEEKRQREEEAREKAYQEAKERAEAHAREMGIAPISPADGEGPEALRDGLQAQLQMLTSLCARPAADGKS